MHFWVINHKETQEFDIHESEDNCYCFRANGNHDWHQEQRGASGVAWMMVTRVFTLNKSLKYTFVLCFILQ